MRCHLLDNLTGLQLAEARPHPDTPPGDQWSLGQGVVGMDNKYRGLLEAHRPHFRHLSADRLLAALVARQVLTPSDCQDLHQLNVAAQPSGSGSSAAADRLLDLLVDKGNHAFQGLCLALEDTYPHILTIMFMGDAPRRSRDAHSVTSDSEDDGPRHVIYLRNSEDGGGHHRGALRAYTRPLSVHEYEASPSNVSLLKAQLKLVSNDRDILREELQRVQTKLDNCSKLVMTSSSDPSKMGSLERNPSRDRDYDWLKSQCDRAMNELQSLKLQHGETVKKYDQAVKEADMFRHKYRLTKDKMDQSVGEYMSLKAKYNELTAECQRLEQEVEDLQKLREDDKREIAELRQQQREVISESGSSEVLNRMYDTAVDKYEEMKKDYESLKKRYAEIVKMHSAARGELELAREENSHWRKKYEDTEGERKAAIMERKALQQQCTTVVRSWDQAISDKKSIDRDLQKIKMERDDYKKGMSQAMADSIKTSKDVTRIRSERDAVVHEYSLIMSERDTVHKEIEQLQDKLQTIEKKLQSTEKDKKDAKDELETLRREIASSLQDRDQAIKQLNDLKQQHKKDSERSSTEKEFGDLMQDRDLDRHDGMDERDCHYKESYEKSQKELADTKDMVNKEAEALKKEIEKLRTELNDSIQEAEVSKRRRDWAFSERDKIVMERESIRTLCDMLRRERDRAVSDLAGAIRDSDELRKQKNDASKELAEIKEKYESLLEKEARKNQLNFIGHNHSRDSAIDTDLQEWETETLEFDISLQAVSSPDSLGFDLVGGKDDPQLPNDSSLFVSSVSRASSAHGKLKVNDQVIQVNNVDVTNVEKKTAVQAAKNGRGVINMVVRRRRSTITKFVQPVHINLSGGKELGVSIEAGLYVSRIIPGSAAAKEGNLAVGDRILNVNGHSAENLSVGEVLNLVDMGGDHVVFNVLKYSPTPQPSLVSSSASSGHNLTENSPDATSTSPKSTLDARMWDGSSPDQNKPDNLNLKTSGSQTDSLDSPPPSSHTQDNVDPDKPNLLDRAYLQIFGKPFHSSQERQEPERETHHKNSHMVAPHANSSERADEAIEELDTLISHHTADEKHWRGKKEADNGGTWPKCRNHAGDFSGQGVFQPINPKKERSRLSAIVPENPYPTNTPSSQPGGQAPPMPPLRSDSFNRGSKGGSSHGHSPQNSDASIVKYNPNLGVDARIHSKSSPYVSSPGKSPNHNLPSPSALDSSLGHEDRKHGSVFDKSPVHYVTSSSPESTAYSDNTVVSAKPDTQDLLKYVRKSRPRPHRYDRSYNMDHGPQRSELGPSKPTSLELQSIYSPRPLPHSANHSITPSQPLSPRGHRNPYSPTGSYMKTSQSYPASRPASSQVLRSTNPTVQVVSSQKVVPFGGQQHPPSSHHHMVSPLNSPPYSSPPEYNSRGGSSASHHPLLNTSIQEVDMGHGAYSMRADRYSTPSPSPSQNSTFDHSTPTPSEDLPFYPGTGGRVGQQPGCMTYPHHRHRNTDRIHIPHVPSNPSVKSSAGKIPSTASSIERVSVSDRASPISPMDFLPSAFLQPSNSLPKNLTSRRKRTRPQIGETRKVYVEKSAELLGIQIEPGQRGGIFVSSVSENSLADQAGIEVGDQLLEVCGINMRNATYKIARNVLSSCRGSITMLVQYNPEKYMDADTSSSGSDPESSASNTPEARRSHKHRVSNETITPETITPQSLSPSHSAKPSDDFIPCEPRFVFLKKSAPLDNMGIGLVGGNSVGIFVHDVQSGSIAAGPQGLRCGDQILEFNGINLRNATAEQAALEISKPADTVTVSILAQYHIAKYNKIRDQPGDAIYIRANLDFDAEKEGELSFKRDDILFIDNTLHNGMVGVWGAWLVDDEGHKLEWGTIPNKSRLEDEMASKRSISDMHDDELKGSRRGSASARRSFFRRKRHQRNNSKDSRDFNSFSESSINSDSIPFLDDSSLMVYQRVERLDCKVCRPVLILGPLAEPLIMKLTSESPDKYRRCETEIVKASLSSLETGQDKGFFVDVKQRDNHFECITVSAVKEIMENNRHCMLRCSPVCIERLHKVQIYPIVLFIRHKSPKQIREVKDTRFMPEKMSNKNAKERFETFQRFEQEYRQLFSDVIPGGNLAFMCFKIKSAVDKEQKKTLWIPSGSI